MVEIIVQRSEDLQVNYAHRIGGHHSSGKFKDRNIHTHTRPRASDFTAKRHRDAQIAFGGNKTSYRV
jgi:hypothetical protein